MRDSTDQMMTHEWIYCPPFFFIGSRFIQYFTYILDLAKAKGSNFSESMFIYFPMGWNHQLHPEKQHGCFMVFPKIGISQNGWWKQGNNPIKMDDLGGNPLFSETSTSKLENRPPARGEHQSNFRLFKSTVGSGKPESHGFFFCDVAELH